MIYAINNFDGLKTHILTADKNSTYSCEICTDRVIPHQGQVKPWHYNHKTNNTCHFSKSKGCYISTVYKNRKCKSALECDKDCKLK